MTEWLHFHFSLSCLGEGNGNPLQCSCLENPRDGGAWWAAISRVTQSRIWLKWISSSSRSHLLIFVFIFIMLGGEANKILLWFLSNTVQPVFIFTNFIVSGLTFRSLVQIKLISTYGVRKYYISFFFFFFCLFKI